MVYSHSIFLRHPFDFAYMTHFLAIVFTVGCSSETKQLLTAKTTLRTAKTDGKAIYVINVVTENHDHCSGKRN